MKKSKRLSPPKYMFALFDKHGLLACPYEAREDAEADAWGPRFSSYTIRVYKLVKKADEP